MKTRLWIALGVALAAPAPGLEASFLADWDFTEGTHGWRGNARVQEVRSTPEGMVVECTGADPWIEGPGMAAPEQGLLRVTLEMRSRADASAQVFYGRSFSADRVESFPVVNDGRFHEYTLVLRGSAGDGTRLRLDPCHDRGRVVLRRLRVEAIRKPVPPAWSRPGEVTGFESTHELRAGSLRLIHHGEVWNRLRLQWNDRVLAGGYDGEMIGWLNGGQVEYLSLREGKLSRAEGEGLRMTVTVRDSEGGLWRLTRTYSLPGPGGHSFEVETRVVVDEDRRAVLLPWLTLLAGHGSHGVRKHQGLFAGLEYLADEPSSSEADILGAASERRVPDPVKITFPLMAIEHEGFYVGLIWERSALVAAGFDSPDRVFGSAGHALWLSGPGVGSLRFENDLVAHAPVELKAGEPLVTRATIIAGENPSVIGAVQDYLARHPLPGLPEFGGGYQAAVDLLSHGWLDSVIQEGGRFKHADWMGRFPPQAAAGPLMYMDWLSGQTEDDRLRVRLLEGVRQGRAELPPADPHAGSVSHVRLPVAPLIYGRVAEYAAMREREARAASRFDEEGRLIYRPGKVDYSKTHFADHANGLGARSLADGLEAVLIGGDQTLAGRWLGLLDRQEVLYAHTVPRGAQTWEVPLHTPDILASAHLVRAYVYGYVLTGNDAYLEQAKYWAWTGVPFVYLSNPTEGECGVYATIAVLGATNWRAPLWLGRPVQWCGLVYGSALHLLSEHDPEGPWSKLARGITLCGLQMTWPTTDPERQGLLPDFFHLVRQTRDGPAINPGTVGAHLPEAFARGKIYQMKKLENGWILHAPCAITPAEAGRGLVRLELSGWSRQPYHALFTGVPPGPFRLESEPPALRVVRHVDGNLAVVKLSGPSRLTIRK